MTVISVADEHADLPLRTPTPVSTPPAPVLIEVAATGDGSGVILAVQRSGATRWLLVGEGPALSRVVEVVLSGAARVFGLAGVVATDGVDPGLDVPTLVAAHDDTEAIGRFWSDYAGRGPAVPLDYSLMLASPRVSSRVRAIHARRVLADDPDHAPRVLSQDALEVLRLLAARVVPQQPEGGFVDLAVRVEQQLAQGGGDGWRHVDLPPAIEAYESALGELAGLTGLDGEGQDHAIRELAGGRWGPWFDDARVDLVSHWVTHPATLARMGYDGLATGGGDVPFPGFVELRLGEREAWEPVMAR